MNTEERAERAQMVLRSAGWNLPIGAVAAVIEALHVTRRPDVTDTLTSNPKRYAMRGVMNQNWWGTEMVEARDGEYVLYEEYERLRRAVETSGPRPQKRYVYDGMVRDTPSRSGWHTEVYLAAEIYALRPDEAAPRTAPDESFYQRLHAALEGHMGEQEMHGVLVECVGEIERLEKIAYPIRAAETSEPDDLHCSDPGWEIRDGKMVCKGCGITSSELLRRSQETATVGDKS